MLCQDSMLHLALRVFEGGVEEVAVIEVGGVMELDNRGSGPTNYRNGPQWTELDRNGPNWTELDL